MCGICGVIGCDQAPTLVRQMNRAMIHRGPDSDGFLEDGTLALGMRRLRIIDLVTGDQPVYNEDHTVAIVFNGEIYNFRDLHRELEAAGHHFTTRSDTETIVHAYEEWGAGCLERLRGMFTFAIYDRRSTAAGGALFLARDRLGIKPLYLWQDGEQLLFASEVRALLASGRIPRVISAAGLYTYLAFGSVQEPLTLLEGIVSLPPASWMRLTWPGGRLSSEKGRYWQPPTDAPSAPSPDHVRAWLADTVSCHLVSDVPLGAFLSGGLDSGAIVALGTQALGRSMNTFTLAFDNWPADERHAAALTATRWKTNHQCRVISSEAMLVDLPLAIAAMDQPTVDGINSWYVSREARTAGLTVALSGVGGDELFAGYRSFRLAPRMKWLPDDWHWLARLPGWQAGWPLLPGGPDMRRKVAAYLTGDASIHHPYFAVRGLLTRSQVQELLQPEISDLLALDNHALRSWHESVAAELTVAARYDAIGEISWLELTQYMRSTLLRDTDMMSMAHSLEVRVPLVDHILANHILPVRGHLKYGDGPKPLMTAAMRGHLPDQIIAGDKRTFTLPFRDWLRKGLAETVRQQLSDPPAALAAALREEMLARMWNDFERERTNWARPWMLFVLCRWADLNL